LSATVASVVAPSLNVTDPPGVPAPPPEALTAAMNVTDWPKTDGFVDDVTTVELGEAFTVCDVEALLER
jgi:hypothetical protein